MTKYQISVGVFEEAVKKCEYDYNMMLEDINLDFCNGERSTVNFDSQKAQFFEDNTGILGLKHIPHTEVIVCEQDYILICRIMEK